MAQIPSLIDVALLVFTMHPRLQRQVITPLAVGMYLRLHVPLVLHFRQASSWSAVDTMSAHVSLVLRCYI